MFQTTNQNLYICVTCVYRLSVNTYHNVRAVQNPRNTAKKDWAARTVEQIKFAALSSTWKWPMGCFSNRKVG